jgi:hypothetical protein
MANASRWFRRLRLPTAPRRAARPLSVLRLEDRVTPSISIPLNAYQWTFVGPAPIAPAQETIPPAAPIAPATPGNLATTGRVVGVVNPRPPADASPELRAELARTLIVSSAGGGVWRSADDGRTWTPTTDNLVDLTILDRGDAPAEVIDRTLRFGALAASPVDGRTVWAGQGNPGGTDQFTNFGGQFTAGVANNQPLLSDLNYSGRGLLKSVDAGRTWKMIKGSPSGDAPFEGVAITKVVPHPTDLDTVFVVVEVNRLITPKPGASNAVYRTTDGGLTWDNITVNLPDAVAVTPGVPPIGLTPISDFSLDPIDPNVGYLSIGDPSRYIPGLANTYNGVYRTVNAMDPNGSAVTYRTAIGGTGGASNVPGTTLGFIRAEPAPSLPSTVYATVANVSSPVGLSQLRMYRSTDSGVNWDPVALPDYQFNYGAYNQALLIDPDNPQRLIIGGRAFVDAPQALFASLDGGATWLNISVGVGGAGPQQVVRSLTFDAAGRLLAATDGGAFRYTFPAGGADGGTWESLNGDARTGLAVVEMTNVGLAPRTANSYVGSTYGSGSFTFVDAGTNATGGIPEFVTGADGKQVPNPAYQNLFSPSVTDATPYSGDIHYSADDPNTVFRILSRTNGGSARVVRSNDAGLTWSGAGIAALPGNNASFDQPAFEMDPSASQRLYVGTDKLLISQNSGASWGNVIGLIDPGGTVDGDITVPDLPFVTGVAAPTGNPGIPITAIGTSRSEFRIVYVAVQERWWPNSKGVLIGYGPAVYRIDTSTPEPRITDGNAFWRDVSPGRFLFTPPGETPPTNPFPFNIRGLPGYPMPGVPEVPEGFTVPGWPMPNQFDLTGGFGRITDLVVDPQDANTVYMTFENDTGAGRVYLTTDGGETWADITGDLGSPGGITRDTGNVRPFTVVFDPNVPSNPADDVLYVGTSTGVWSLTDPQGNESWVQVGGPTGLPDVQVRDLKINTATGILAAATLGRGVWQYQIRPLVSGVLFDDTNGNGVRDAGEPPSKGVTIGAYDLAVSSKTPVASTVTLDNGFYEFRSLPDGQYQFRPVSGVGGGQYQTTPTVQVQLDKFTTIPGNVGPGGTVVDVPPADIGSFRLTTIGGALFDDTNGNGVRDAGEPPLAGVLVRLRAVDRNGNRITAVNPATGQPVPTVTTDAAGAYTFTGLAPFQDKTVPFDPDDGFYVNEYVVEVDALLPAGKSRSSAAVAPLRLTSGTPVGGRDVGLFTQVTIRGVTFNDSNADGILQGEPRLGGIGVRLVRPGPDAVVGTADDILVATATTNPDGEYSFPGLAPTPDDPNSGPFEFYLQQVLATLPAGYVPTSGTKSADGQFAVLGPIRPTSGQPTEQLVPSDFGSFLLAGLSGVVFDDTDGDGRLTPSESKRVIGATVVLIDPGPDGDSRTEIDNVVVASTVTDAAGSYTFPGLRPLVPGNTRPYFVRAVAPADLFIQTSADARGDLVSGQVTKGLNLGYFRRTTVAGFAFEDVNGNGLRDAGEPAAVNFPVSLLNSDDPAAPAVATTTTDATGQYKFGGLGPLQANAAAGPGGAVIAYRVQANLGGFIQTNDPGDVVLRSGVPATGPELALFKTVAFNGLVYDDVNGNGARDAGEPGTAGVVVQLVNADGTDAKNKATQLPIRATTAADGRYSIQAPNGTFSLRLPTLPAGTIQTTAFPPNTLTTSGAIIPPIDLGTFRTFDVAGRVYDDLNGNGVADAGEPGVANIVVRLTTAGGAATAFAATTAADGSYAIRGVGPGTFRVTPGLVAGQVFTTPGGPTTLVATSGLSVPAAVSTFGVFRTATVRGLVFEDVNRNGVQDTGETGTGGWTVQVVNGAGAVLASGTTDGGGNYVLTGVGAGAVAVSLADRPGWLRTLSPLPLGGVLLSGGTATPAALAGVRLGSVSGRVFNDANRNGRLDGSETGLAGVPLELVQNGNLVGTATSRADGWYDFLNLAGGSYTVRVRANSLAAGLVQTGPQTTNLQYPVTVTEGSTSAANRLLTRDFGVAGRKRYAVAADGGGGPRVQVYDAVSGVLLRDQFVYEETFTGGVRVASADVNGDGIDDLITVAGKGGGPRVRVLDGVTGNTVYDYFAYEPTFRDGLFVAAADVNGDGFADILTGTDAGGGPRVTVFSGKDGRQLLDFFAFDDAVRSGVRIGAADIDGDGKAEVIAATGVGQAAEVRVFAADGRRVNTFAPVGGAFTGGLYVAGGAVDPATGRAAVLVGTGAGFGEQGFAFVFDGLTGSQTFQLEAFPQQSMNAPFYTGDVRVASFDTTGDGVPEIVIASGQGIRSMVRTLDGNNRREISTLMPFEAAFLGGLFIG